MNPRIVSMRKLFPLFCLLIPLSFSVAYSQTTNTNTNTTNIIVKQHNNEIGMDISGFIKQVFNIGNSLDTYTPNYYITYRHHFKKSNLRMALGGFGQYSDATGPSQGGSQARQHVEGFSIDYRIGYEWVSAIGDKWQIFYGLDARPSFFYSKQRINQIGSGTTTHYETFAQIYGLAPVFGFRFKITERLSLITETSVAFNLQVSNGKSYISTPGQPNYNLPDSYRTRFYTSYYQPISITFTYDI